MCMCISMLVIITSGGGRISKGVIKCMCISFKNMGFKYILKR